MEISSLMMHSMFKSPIVSALYPFFAKYFSLWPLVMLTWWSKGDGWECCGVGPMQVGEMGIRGACSQNWKVFGKAQKAKTEEQRRRNLLRPHVCVSRDGQTMGYPGNWCSVGGLGLHLRPQHRCTCPCLCVIRHHKYGFRDGRSHLKCFHRGAPLTVSKRSSVEYSSNTPSMSFMSVSMAAMYGFFLCWRLFG